MLTRSRRVSHRARFFGSAFAVIIGASCATFAACAGDEREHAPLPDAGPSSSSGPTSGGGDGGHGGSPTSSSTTQPTGGAGGAGGGTGEGGAGGAADPTCVDLKQNGEETGVDCGGVICPLCGDGQGCADDNDCQSGVCGTDAPTTCQAAACDDGVKNGTETDVDCGGPGAPGVKCGIGKGCTAAADCIADSCEAGHCACPAGMLIVPIAGEGSYCIDQTEVSYKEYAVFYNASVPPLPQFKPSPQCTGNDDYVPEGWPPSSDEQLYPVLGADWCDAYAYCAYVGKRLCGKIGGGSNASTDYADYAKSQWHNACTANGVNPYPYGASYQPSICNGIGYPIPDGGVAGPVQVEEATGAAKVHTCIGGVSTFLYHMSGNVEEWEDSCDDTAPTAQCRLRGGSHLSDAAALACSASASATRMSKSQARGFRCCL